MKSLYSEGTLARDALKNFGLNDVYFLFGGGFCVCIGIGFVMMESVFLFVFICNVCELCFFLGLSVLKLKVLIILRSDEIKFDVGLWLRSVF